RPVRAAPPRPARADGIPLVAFHRHLVPADDELDRDLGLAAVHLAEQARGAAPALAAALTAQALPLLERAAARASDDVPAWESLGFARTNQGRADAALAFDAALARAPDRERALMWAADAAAARRDYARAEPLARRLAARYPHYPLHQARLAHVLSELKAWPEAVAAADAAVRGDPLRADFRAILVTALVGAGDAARARIEFARLAVIDPPTHTRLLPQVEGRLR
ncbi:MAG TPA: hypothetical protein VH092_34520, partial [Urbifossiella sp.]|nr:hypothetical protein [Urbifossiella sp.]